MACYLKLFRLRVFVACARGVFFHFLMTSFCQPCMKSLVFGHVWAQCCENFQGRSRSPVGTLLSSASVFPSEMGWLYSGADIIYWCIMHAYVFSVWFFFYGSCSLSFFPMFPLFLPFAWITSHQGCTEKQTKVFVSILRSLLSLLILCWSSKPTSPAELLQRRISCVLMVANLGWQRFRTIYRKEITAPYSRECNWPALHRG